MALDWVIVLFLIGFGLFLIVAEIIIIPGTTFVGILGFVILAGGVYLAFQDFGFETGIWVAICSGGAGLAAILYGLRSDTWNKFSLNSEINSRFNEEFPHMLEVGMTGKTTTRLRPYGKAEFSTGIVEIRTFGDYLEVGEEVRVAKIENNIVFVEPLSLYK